MNIKRFVKSFKHALDGIKHVLDNDQNLAIHLVVALLVIIASILLRVTPFEMAILGLTMVVDVSAEMVNSAIEKMVDLITSDHKVEAKVAKDVAAGMVLLTAIGAIIIGVLIFLPYLLRLM